MKPVHIGHVPDPFGGDGYLVYVTPASRFDSTPGIRVESADSSHFLDAEGARELAHQLLRAALHVDGVGFMLQRLDPPPVTEVNDQPVADGNIVRGDN